MTISELLPAIQAEILAEADLNRPAGKIVACDLMSDVLVVDEDDVLLLTSLTSDQAVRTAQVVGASAVVVVNDKPLPSGMIELAKNLRITLAVTSLSKYDACVALHEAMKKG